MGQNHYPLHSRPSQTGNALEGVTGPSSYCGGCDPQNNFKFSVGPDSGTIKRPRAFPLDFSQKNQEKTYA